MIPAVFSHEKKWALFIFFKYHAFFKFCLTISKHSYFIHVDCKPIMQCPNYVIIVNSP